MPCAGPIIPAKAIARAHLCRGMPARYWDATARVLRRSQILAARHAPHARPPTLRPSPEDGPAPPPRGDLRRGRLSHRRDLLASAGIAPPTVTASYNRVVYSTDSRFAPIEIPIPMI